MPARKHITPGQKFHRLTVIKEVAPIITPSGEPKRCVFCHCDCGAEKEVRLADLLRGRTRSCGCLCTEIVSSLHVTHGGCYDRLYRIYGNMKFRCGTPGHPDYAHYGGRGITVCVEWQESYSVFREWALANGYKDNLTIERKDVNQGYNPENCCFIPATDQPKNTRKTVLLTAFGETKTLTDWSRDPRCPITHSSLSDRIRNGEDHLSAITRPPNRAVTQFKKR